LKENVDLDAKYGDNMRRNLLTLLLGALMPRFLLLFTIALSVPSFAATPKHDSQTPAELAVEALVNGMGFVDPVDILAWVDLPRSATVDQVVVMKITIENGRSNQPFELESIDLDGNFGKSFRVSEVRPKPIDSDSTLNTLTLEYSLSIAPGQRAVFEIQLVARKAGVFVGEVDIWEGDDFLTRAAQCKVEK
jgi:hypothetical protein